LVCFGLGSSWGGLGSVTVTVGWGGAGLVSAGAAAVTSGAPLGWQAVKAKPARVALNRVKVGRCLFTAANLTACLVSGKAGK